MDLEEMLKHVFSGSEVEVYRIDENGMFQICGRQPATMDNWELIDVNSGMPVPVGEILRTPDGDEYELLGGRPPHDPSSTGRVYVRDEEDWEREFFPSVFDCEWRYKKNES